MHINVVNEIIPVHINAHLPDDDQPIPENYLVLVHSFRKNRL